MGFYPKLFIGICLKKLIIVIFLFFIPSFKAAEEPVRKSLFIEDLSIEEAMQFAMERNLPLLSKKFDIDIARARTIQAGMWRNPSISLLQSLMPFEGGYNQTTTGGPQQLDFLLNIPIDATGKIKTYKNYIDSLRKLQEVSFYSLQFETVLNVFNSYTQVLYLEKLKALHKNREDSLARLVRMIQNRMGGDGIQPLLLTRAQLALNNARIETKMVQLNLSNAKKALAQLLGFPHSPNFNLTSDFRKIDLRESPDYKVSENFMKQNYPAFLAFKLNQEIAENYIEYNYAKVWNDFTFFLGVSRQAGVSANPGSFLSSSLPGQTSWAVGINIPLPVFDKNSGEILAAKLLREQADYDLRNFEIGIEKDLQQTLETIHLHYQLIEEMEKVQLERAETVLVTQQKLFGTGGSNLLDYFDAINAHISTLTMYYLSVSEYRKNWARYYFLTGLSHQ